MKAMVEGCLKTWSVKKCMTQRKSCLSWALKNENSSGRNEGWWGMSDRVHHVVGLQEM